MPSQARSTGGQATAAFISWLVTGAVGPALVALPVNLLADKLADAAIRWFKRVSQTDDLSRLVKAAAGTSVQLSRAEIKDLRELLGDERTWRLLAVGKLNEKLQELIGQIADCLPARDGRTTDDARVAASAVARGLLEFAIFDLQPEVFQKVVLARLQQMSDQATALDDALFRMHQDLYAFTEDAKDLFRQVMDRLPPGPAGLGVVRIYLTTLIDWLSTDPWPRDRRFAGPLLIPAAIERKLRVTIVGQREQDVDADRLAQQCRRLVLLGGPGSGKTWLAKRTARRCAEDALAALAAGRTPDEVELPLYTTCSQLLRANGDIRTAVVSSALDQLGDVGSSRMSEALRVFFTERNAPTVLVIDSLDEAHGSDQRLRQADTLPWRIVLTSRPTSWNNQFAINEANASDRIGELQGLRFPDDVESFIRSWYAGQPRAGNDLAVQIARRPDLQQAATVPLILAFYCLIGGNEPLPDARHDLYGRVLKRMITGRWRGSDDSQPDLDACLEALRGWAWAGATNHSISEVGTWVDDIPTRHPPLGKADQDAVDHVAAPLGPPDIDTGKTLRRFVHRSIREYLVAEYVASLPLDRAVEVLLPHLWYDPDWEYVAPVAIAMSPEHDQLLRNLIRRAARSGHVPPDLSVIDARWEFGCLLTRVAAETSDADWSPELASLIGHAREDLARSPRIAELPPARWATSNRQARAALLGLLGDQTDSTSAIQLVDGLLKLDPTADDKYQAVDSLVRLFAVEESGREAMGLLRAVLRLAATAEERNSIGEALLRILAVETSTWKAEWLVDSLLELDPADERRQRARAALLALLPAQEVGWHAESLVGSLARLVPTDEEKRQARETLLRLITSHPDSSVCHDIAAMFAQLDSTMEDRQHAREVLLHRLAEMDESYYPSAEIKRMLVQLAPTPAEKRQTRAAALELLGVQDVSSPASLVDVLLQLDPTTEDQQQIRAVLQNLLSNGETSAERLIARLLQLDLTRDEAGQARAALLGLLASDRYGWSADGLVRKLISIDPTADEISRARGMVLRLFPTQSSSTASSLVDALLKLDPSTEEKTLARASLIRVLAAERDVDAATGLARRLLQLDPTPVDMSGAREAMLRLLPRWQAGEAAEASVAVLALLTPAAQDKRQLRATILESLRATDDQRAVTRFVQGLLQLDPTTEDKLQARTALHRLAAAATSERSLCWVVDLLSPLGPTAEERTEERSALLRVLANESGAYAAARLVSRLVALEPTADEKGAARESVIRSLAADRNPYAAQDLMDAFVQLNPDVFDLSGWHAWAALPTTELLIAARCNSTKDAWLAALPALSASSP